MERPTKKQKMTDISHFDNPKFSDLLIRSSGLEFHAHKVTVCQKSGYFRNALEKDFAESQTGVIDLKDHDEVEIMYALLRHIYGHPYDETTGSEPDEASPGKDLLFHVDVFAAADYYDVPSLRQLITERLPALMETEWRQSIDRSSKLSPPQDNINTAIRGIFAHQNADTALQRMAINFCTPRIYPIVKDHAMMITLKDTGALAAGILDKLCVSHCIITERL